jgi:hypothetical protein
MNARHTDPISSHIAGYEVEASGKAHNQRLISYQAVKRYPGLTSKELAMVSGIDRYILARRLPELQGVKQGNDRFKRICRVSKRLSVIWELK